jgi:hypothetical protein
MEAVIAQGRPSRLERERLQEAQNAASTCALYELARDQADLPECLPESFQRLWRAWEGDDLQFGTR